MTEMRERRFFCFSTHTNPSGTALHGVLIALNLLRGLGGRGGRFGVLENMRCGSFFVVCWARINSGIAILRPSRLVTSHYIEGLCALGWERRSCSLGVYPSVEIPTEF